MHWKFILAVVVLAAAVPAGAQMPLAPSHSPSPLPASLTGQSPAAAVARVNGVALTQAELNAAIERVFPYYQVHGGRVPASAESEIRSKAMDKLILNQLLAQEATRRKLQVNEVELSKGLKEVRDGFASRQAYESAVAKQFGSVRQFERRVRTALLVDQLWKQEVTRKARVTDPELAAYYRQNKGRFLRPESVWLQTISLNVAKNATGQQVEKARARAEELLARARQARDYESFGLLAEETSEDRWRVMMGDHKWVHRGTFDAAYEDVIFAMQPGEVRGVVRSDTGFHIFRVNQRQASKQMAYADVKQDLRKRLEQERLTQRAEAFERSLRQQAKIEIY